MKNKLIKKFFCTALLIIIISPQLISQNIPDYPERSFLSVSDTLLTSISSQPTEGAVDPEEYVVGPGDKIFISISGIREDAMTLVVDQEGFLYLPRIGGIDLRNKTLKETKQIILSEIDKNFKNVEVFISLLDFRKIKVSLIGDVVKPSIYVLTSNSRLLDLLKISSGITPTSNMRNIAVKSKSGNETEYDFLSFLRFGDYTNNPLLKEGDVVIIDRVDRVIRVSGNVKFPAVYEYKQDEDVYSILKLAGGLNYKARLDSIEIVSFVDNGKFQKSKFFSYEYLKANKVPVEINDHIMVREIPEYFQDHFVNIMGKVRYPGYYKIIKDSTRLSEVISNAGGFLEDASLINATLFRTDADSSYDPEFDRLKIIPRADMTDDEYDYYKAKSRQRKGKVVVDFVQLFQNNKISEDVILRNGDVINIPLKVDYITLIGQVVNPGNVIFDRKLTTKDYINLAGGFSWRAIEGDVRVIKANTGEWIDADEILNLEPGDIIWVPENPPAPTFWTIFSESLSTLAQLATVVAASVAVIVALR